MNTVVIDEDLGELSYEIYMGQPYLHLVLSEWNRDAKKECLEHLEDVKIMFREDGYTRIYAAADRDNVKLQKFLKLFGFNILAHNDEHILYVQEIV